MASVVSISNISKRYGAITALSNVSLEVPAGSVFGILGPNGSGKTTLLATLLDVLKADSGTYQWFGAGTDATAARWRIGALLETPNFYPYLSAFDNLEITAAIKRKGKDRREEVLRQVGLYERKDSKFSTYSLGMKQRLAIGAALLASPEVLLLDEPTNGLDPSGITEIRNLIQELNSRGTTVILASHLLDEVEKVCTHFAILKKGTLLQSGSVGDQMSGRVYVEVAASDQVHLRELLSNYSGVTSIEEGQGHLLLSGERLSPEAINRYLSQQGIYLTHLAVKKQSLESMFMEVTS